MTVGKLVTFERVGGGSFSVDCEAVSSVDDGQEPGTLVMRYVINEHSYDAATLVGTSAEITAALNAAMGT